MHLTEQASKPHKSTVESPGSAGAPALNETEPVALRFRSSQDALDYASHCVEDSRSRAMRQNFKAIDLYEKCEAACYVRIKAGRDGKQYHLAFFRHPSPSEAMRIGGVTDWGFGRHVSREVGDGIAYGRRDQVAMFLRVTELIQGPKGVIPSFVWLEGEKELQDIRVQIGARFSPFNMICDFSERVPEGELSLFELGIAARDRGSVAGLVQDRSEIVSGIEQDAWEHLRRVIPENDFVNIVSRLRIFIDDSGPWLTFDKTGNFSFEVVDVMICSPECPPSAIKDIIHGRQARSNERS